MPNLTIFQFKKICSSTGHFFIGDACVTKIGRIWSAGWISALEDTGSNLRLWVGMPLLFSSCKAECLFYKNWPFGIKFLVLHFSPLNYFFLRSSQNRLKDLLH